MLLTLQFSDNSTREVEVTPGALAFLISPINFLPRPWSHLLCDGSARKDRTNEDLAFLVCHELAFVPNFGVRLTRTATGSQGPAQYGSHI